MKKLLWSDELNCFIGYIYCVNCADTEFSFKKNGKFDFILILKYIGHFKWHLSVTIHILSDFIRIRFGSYFQPKTGLLVVESVVVEWG